MEKLKNGKWQVRKMIKGKTYYLYFDTKPSHREIKNSLLEKLKYCNKEKTNTTKILSNYLKEYINNKSNTLSPSTIRGYLYILKTLPTEISNLKIENINNNILQKYINQMAINRTTKTIKNHLQLILATLNFNGYEKKFFLQYPKEIQKQIYIPTDNDISKINITLSGTKYYTFFRLCLYGLRVSEILALTTSDIATDGTIKINKAKVQDYKNQWHTKTTKTYNSTRIIKINTELAIEILKRGYLFKHTYKQFYRYFTLALKQLNINHFSPHKLRHYIASKMHSLNIPSKYIEAYGGWASDRVLKKIYTHIISIEKEKYFDLINKELNKIIK